ncbi:porin [Humisphaera borealis]|uniref:Porin n=1 Tax=Humisphaera borealis TaxID=2807512 RepID=A0A7M2X070_9BACT|nr:porin [Humisphaera borealis]QOV91156.1 porin [Humisphaera borealis]
MSNRKLLSAAACAVLGMSGLARADEVAPAAPSFQPYALLVDEAPARKPLMALLDKAGFAKGMDDIGLTVGGRVEGSYTYSFSSPPGNVITGRVFDFENQDLTLNQLAFVLDKQVKSDAFDVGGRVEVIWGSDSRLIHSVGLFDHYDSSSPANQWDLNQAYLDINFPSVAKVRVGKFNTPVGYEVIDPTGNALYSHSFMFGYAIPFTHTGVTATFKLNEDTALMVGVTRGWDTSTEDNNDTVDFMGQIAYAFPKGEANLYLTVISGADQAGDNDNWRTLVDLIYTRSLGDNVTVALNADYAYEANSATAVGGSDAQWFGVAGYLGVKMSDMVTLNTRLEYFNDQDGARLTGGVGGTSLYGATAGLSIRPFAHDALGQNLVIRPEIRFDYAEKKFFDGATDRYQLTAAIDAIFSF